MGADDPRVAKSSFLMVSRTKEQNNGVPVPKLVPADAEESERFRQVQQRRSHRGRPVSRTRTRRARLCPSADS